jgi:transposase
LPEHLPREEVVLNVDSESCTCGCGALHAIGETVHEMLDRVPTQLCVVRITRPKFVCCNRVARASAPELPIGGRFATDGTHHRRSDW